jgi:hypothetical protein
VKELLKSSAISLTRDLICLAHRALDVFTFGLLFGGGAIIGAAMVLRIAKATAGVE